ncbi:MAG: DUF3392 family protein [Gammaproteobacteria bacterium]|nr:DUF3392 family protein [Gammaproteobacteria bacterium]
MNEFINFIAGHIRSNLMQVSIIVVTCSLVVFDSYIRASMKRMVRGYHFVIRVLAYIFLFAVLYGFIVTYLSPVLARTLVGLAPASLVMTIAFLFIVLGYLIERR